MRKFCVSLVVAVFAISTAAVAKQPLRPPNGTYEYTLSEGGGRPDFTSTIEVRGSGPTFTVSEKVKLPGGQVAATQCTWSSATLLPESFDVRQGKIHLHSQITIAKLMLKGSPHPFARISGTAAILPSVGLISTDLMFAYVLLARSGEALTLAEIQNNQTVVVRNAGSPAQSLVRNEHVTIVLTKQEKHGVDRDEEHIVASLNRSTGIIERMVANPGDARIILTQYSAGK